MAPPAATLHELPRSPPAPLIGSHVAVLQDKDLRDVGDWRKNIEDKSGMDGRKKMFEAEA